MPRPFEVDSNYLAAHLDELVSATFADLQSQFLVLPKGPNFIEYSLFQSAYEILRTTTDNFRNLNPESIWSSFDQNPLCFVVLRTILGMSPPEWAELVRSDLKIDIPQNIVRDLDARCRRKTDFFRKMLNAREGSSYERVAGLIVVAVNYIKLGAPAGAANTVHRLAKVDTAEGLTSLTHAAMQHVPYPTLLYERYLGRPFASHRDSVSELVGDVMESAIEDRLSHAGIPYRKTKRAEKVPGFEQAPDFFIPNEFSPDVIIEAKITGDDGTARDKATRMINLAKMRDEKIATGGSGFQVIACIDGRGFGVRREDMRRLILKLDGKVFTLASLDRLISCTRLSTFLPYKP